MQQNPITQLENLVENTSILPETVKDIAIFLGIVFLGVFYKVRKEHLNGKSKKATVAWFVAEALMSLFIALIGLWTLDYFFSLPKLFSFGICALLGSMSSTVHEKIESVLIYTFDSAKVLIDKKLKSNNND